MSFEVVQSCTLLSAVLWAWLGTRFGRRTCSNIERDQHLEYQYPAGAQPVRSPTPSPFSLRITASFRPLIAPEAFCGFLLRRPLPLAPGGGRVGNSRIPVTGLSCRDRRDALNLCAKRVSVIQVLRVATIGGVHQAYRREEIPTHGISLLATTTLGRLYAN